MGPSVNHLRPRTVVVLTVMMLAGCAGSSDSTDGRFARPGVAVGARLDPTVLRQLRCPLSGGRLRLASEDETRAIRSGISSGRIRLHAGGPVSVPFTALLIRSDRRIAYPVRGLRIELRASAAIALSGGGRPPDGSAGRDAPSR